MYRGCSVSLLPAQALGSMDVLSWAASPAVHTFQMWLQFRISCFKQQMTWNNVYSTLNNAQGCRAKVEVLQSTKCSGQSNLVGWITYLQRTCQVSLYNCQILVKHLFKAELGVWGGLRNLLWGRGRRRRKESKQNKKAVLAEAVSAVYCVATTRD